MRILKESAGLRTLLMLFTSALVALTVGVGLMALVQAGWGAFWEPEAYKQAMIEHWGWSQANVNMIYTQRYTVLYGACILVVVGILLIFVLCTTYGYKRGHEGIVLRWQDRIPLDLFAVAAAGLESGFIYLVLIGAEASWSPQSLMGLAGFSALPASFFGIQCLLTLAVRVKAGKWWRNTICCKVLGGCFRFFRKCLFGVSQTTAEGMDAVKETMDVLPLAWKVPAAALAYLGANALFFLLFFMLRYRDLLWMLALLLWIAFNGAAMFWLMGLAKQMMTLRDGAKQIAAGELDYQIETKGMMSEFRQHGETLNNLRDGLGQAVEQRMKSERLKTELITNVSHDIKTPLTSIINYVDLLQKENIEGPAQEYLEVLSRQSSRLKRLIENLVEASKASTGNIKINLQRMGVGEFINQVVAEYADRLEACRLRPVVSVPEKELYIMADGRLLWRVFDNLLNNICKYAMEGTRVYVDVHEHAGEAQIIFKNISKECLNVAADELMERFVRGDSSRNTEGSGLGLSIAQSLTQNQHGTFDLFVDGDLFKAVVCFQTVPVPAAVQSENNVGLTKA